MSARRNFKLKSNNIFDQMRNRESGIHVKPEFYYVPFCLPHAIRPSTAKLYYTAKGDYLFHTELALVKAHQSEADAELEALSRIQNNYYPHREEWWTKIETLIKDSWLTSAKDKPICKEDLCEDAYWIFKMRGNAAEYNCVMERIRTDDKTEIYFPFSNKLFSIRNNTGTRVYTLNDYLNEPDNKNDHSVSQSRSIL